MIDKKKVPPITNVIRYATSVVEKNIPTLTNESHKTYLGGGGGGGGIQNKHEQPEQHAMIQKFKRQKPLLEFRSSMAENFKK